MPREPQPGSPQDWQARAHGKLALTRVPLPAGGYYEDLAYFAQQAAELSIKAVYRRHGLMFAFTHSLGRLLDDLESGGIAVPDRVRACEELTAYATRMRYPGTDPRIGEDEYTRLAGLAEAVVSWMDDELSFAPGSPPQPPE